MNEQDRVRLRHMLEAAEEAIGFAEGRSRQDLETDRQFMRALIQDITIVGEAAARVSRECQTANPQIPWPDIVGMRNRLVHAYFDINLDRVWDTVVHNLPQLVAELKKLVPPEGDG